MTVKLLTEHHLEFLSLKGGCTGSSESILVKMSNCWKSPVRAHMQYNELAIFFWFKDCWRQLQWTVQLFFFCFSPGSVIAVIFLSVNQSGNTSTTRDLLAQSVQSGYLGELAVDSTYFYANVGGKYIFSLSSWRLLLVSALSGWLYCYSFIDWCCFHYLCLLG